MTTDRKLVYALAGVLTMAGCVMVHDARLEHVREQDAASTMRADHDTIIDLQKQRDRRDEADKMQQADARVAAEAVKSSTDAVRVITKYLPAPAGELPGSIVIAPADIPAPERAKLPESPSYVLQTESAAVAAAKNFLSCDADRQSLATCKADLSDADAQRTAETHTADTLQALVKGGTRAHRLLGVVKCVATAGAGGYLGSLTKQPKWAAVGAGAGAVACHLF